MAVLPLAAGTSVENEDFLAHGVPPVPHRRHCGCTDGGHGSARILSGQAGPCLWRLPWLESLSGLAGEEGAVMPLFSFGGRMIAVVSVWIFCNNH